jgi:hypothetical protein
MGGLGWGARLVALVVIVCVGCTPTASDDDGDGEDAVDARVELGPTGGADGSPDLGEADAAPTPAPDQGPIDAVVDAVEDVAMAPPVDAAVGFRCTRNFECNDGNECTDDVCTEGACGNPFNAAPCGDEVFCNGLERCAEGACAPGPAPCPSMDDCDEAMGRCTACETDDHCPAPDVVGETLCEFEHPCDGEGSITQFVATYGCVETACVATQSERQNECNRETDGLPCGAGAICVDGRCPRDPLINVVCSGFTNFNARLTVRCAANNQVCTVEGNADRQNRGVMSQRCEILCPARGALDVCCSNGSVPCGGARAPIQGNSRITDMQTMGLEDTNCTPDLAGGNLAECAGIVGEHDARVECVFGR